MRAILKPIVHRAMIRTKGESAKGIAKRHEALVGKLIRTGRVAIVIIVLSLIPSGMEIYIGPVLTGFGIAGIAVSLVLSI